MIFQRSQRHKLIYQEALVSISTVANQVDQIRVMQEAQHQHLYQKFSIALKAIPVKLFHCNHLPTNKVHLFLILF